MTPAASTILRALLGAVAHLLVGAISEAVLRPPVPFYYRPDLLLLLFGAGLALAWPAAHPDRRFRLGGAIARVPFLIGAALVPLAHGMSLMMLAAAGVGYGLGLAGFAYQRSLE